MKRILILSYHFPPLQVIASLRAQAFAKWLGKSHWDITVVSPNWDSNATEPVTIDNPDFRHICTPLVKGSSDRRNKVMTFHAFTQGRFDLHQNLSEYRDTEKQFLEQHLQEEKYDLLLGIFSPHYHLEHCFWAHETFGIPYVLDFRDLWDPRLLQEGFKPSMTEKVQFGLIAKHWKKWCSKALMLSTVSEPYAQFLQGLTERTCVTITNGFEPDLFKGIEQQRHSGFVISHIGSFYPNQELEILFAACAKCKDQIEGLTLRFIGVKNPQMRRRIEILTQQFGLSEIVKQQERIPRDKALEAMTNSDVVYYPAWKGYQGVYSGKIFEYLASGTPILVCPGDRGVVDALISETRTGMTFYTAEEAAEWLIQLSRGDHKHAPNQSVIEAYSRKRQVEHYGRLLFQAAQHAE